MAGARASVGTRGSFWLTQSQAEYPDDEPGPSRPRLTANFANRYPIDPPASLIPSSQPLQVFPPSRTNAFTTDTQPSDSITSLSWLRSSHEAEFDDVPNEVLHSLLQESDSRVVRKRRKLAVANCFAQYGCSLVIHVGGPDDRAIYISVLRPAQTTQEQEHGRKRSKGKGKATQADVLEKGSLETSLLPAFQSTSPILSISLAPAHDKKSKSHLHEGPWLSILTATSLHFCAVHRLGHGLRSRIQDSLPEFVMTHICTFLTKEVSQHSTLQDQGVVNVLHRHHIVDVAWHPTRRTAALIGDASGRIWLWELDTATSGNHQWISRGQKVRQAAVLSLDFGEELLRLSWLDPKAPLDAIAMTSNCIWNIDISTGVCERKKRLKISSTYLAPASFHHMLNLNIVTTNTSPVPLLVAVSSVGIHVLDVFHPDNELFFVPHHRMFLDTTLHLSTINVQRNAKVACIALCSLKDPITTVYHFGYDLIHSESGPDQAAHVWQDCPPSELRIHSSNTSIGSEIAVHPWTDCFAHHPLRQDEAHSESRAMFSRSSNGEVTLQLLDARAARRDSSNLPQLPIRLVPNPALDELKNLMSTKSSIWRMENVSAEAPLVKSQYKEPSSLSRVWNGLFALSQKNSLEGTSLANLQRKVQVARALQSGASALDNPNTSFMTAMDLVACASLNLGGAPNLSPFASPHGAISALYAPHAASLNADMQHLEVTLQPLLTAVRSCQQQGWWDAERCCGSGLFPGTSILQEDNSISTAMAKMLKSAQTMADEYFKGEEASGNAALVRNKMTASAAALQIFLHCTLSQEVWSSRPIEIQENKTLESIEGTTDQSIGLSQHNDWTSSSQMKSSGLGNLLSRGEDEPSTRAKRKRHGLSQDPFDSASQGGSQVSIDAENIDDEVETLDNLARQKIPEPPPVHLSYFRSLEQPQSPSQGRSTSQQATKETKSSPDFATPAARVLLSSWPLNTLNPRDPENDPSYYTYTDPYTLLDAAKVSNEDGYASSTTAHSTDTGWSSAWSATSASGLSGSERDRSRSQSVWSSSAFGGRGSSAAPSSQAISSGIDQGIGSQDAWSRMKAPPSIASRSAWDRPPSQAHYDGYSQPTFPAQSQGAASSLMPQSQTFGSFPMDAASQPMPGIHASRKIAKAKKQKKRLGGF
ncbi:unnamed protein product [Sympodiomycopsis kandeliae]